MYKVTTKNFRKNYKKIARSGNFDLVTFNKVVNTLAAGQTLDRKYRDHALKGNMKDVRECHLKPDLLLVYKIYKNKLILELVKIGSHAEVLDM